MLDVFGHMFNDIRVFLLWSLDKEKTGRVSWRVQQGKLGEDKQWIIGEYT